MKENLECPRCKRIKYRIIKGLCQSCYIVLFNKKRFNRKYPKDIILSNEQKEFVTGCLLGDAWISNLKYGRKNPNFGIDRKLDDLDRYNTNFSLVKDHKDKEQYCIRAGHISSMIVLNDIKNNFPLGMNRKLNERIIL